MDRTFQIIKLSESTDVWANKYLDPHSGFSLWGQRPLGWLRWHVLYAWLYAVVLGKASVPGAGGRERGEVVINKTNKLTQILSPLPVPWIFFPRSLRKRNNLEFNFYCYQLNFWSKYHKRCTDFPFLFDLCVRCSIDYCFLFLLRKFSNNHKSRIVFCLPYLNNQHSASLGSVIPHVLFAGILQKKIHTPLFHP